MPKQNRLKQFFSTPCEKVELFSGAKIEKGAKASSNDKGYVHGGGFSKEGCAVRAGNEFLPRQIYILKLVGNAGNFVGYETGNQSIYKIGMSASPESRRQSFQKALPHGAYQWKTLRSNSNCGLTAFPNYHIAKAGEDAMKLHLSKNAKWLGGEFYLASDEVIDRAWEIGVIASRSLEKL